MCDDQVSNWPREGLLDYLVKTQRDDGSWGRPPHDTFAPLALLASGNRKHLDLVRKSAKFHARTTKSKDRSWLINWRYMAAAIVMSEFYLATGEEWVLPELQEFGATISQDTKAFVTAQVRAWKKCVVYLLE